MRGLLFSQMEPPPGWEADFHDWYETEHIPARMRLPSFASAVRYRATVGEPAYLACYFLDDVGVLDTPAYRALKADPGERTERMLANVLGFTRYIADELFDSGEPREEPGLLSVVAFAVPDDAATRAAFEGWYGEEHVPLLLEVPGWLRVRRYVTRPGGDGPPWTHLALHELRGPEVLEHPARAAARDTPRRAALAAEPWFARSGRWQYRPIHRAVAAAA
jgi:hypothetical protein